MIEIDRMPRITIRNLKGIFKNADKIREALPTTAEENIPKLLKLFDEFCAGSLELAGITYHISVKATAEADIEAIFFEWENDGRKYRQRVYISYEESNLGKGYLVFFLCPYTGRKCRKLYTDGTALISRYGFEHTYSQRNQSKKWRELDKMLHFLDNEPVRKFGKMEYRGKLTPYGKKLIKFWNSSPDVEDFSFMHKRRGRPPKPAAETAATPKKNAEKKSGTTRNKPHLFLE